MSDTDLQHRARRRIARVNPCKPTDDDDLICNLLMRVDELERGTLLAKGIVDLTKAVGQADGLRWEWLIRTDKLLGFFANIFPDIPSPFGLAFGHRAHSPEEAIRQSLEHFEHYRSCLPETNVHIFGNQIEAAHQDAALISRATEMASAEELRALREEGQKMRGPEQWTLHINAWAKKIVEKYDRKAPDA